MKRHVNVPVFVPHMGCPNQCVFCNQRLISGKNCFSVDSVRREIEVVLSTTGDAVCEIAFFGGSFTGIERGLMIELLDMASEYVASGQAVGIRMSTRPDYISSDIVEILARYPVTCVELGVQSMSDRVLNACRRGHKASDTERAFALLRSASIPVVGQMMIGLPEASSQDEIYCAEVICKMGAVGTRIYPTLVFRGTELEELYENGHYVPLTVSEAVERSKSVLDVFVRHGVPCLRIGLCESENLHSDTSYVAGPNHSAIGELVMSRLYRDRIFDALPATAETIGPVIIKVTVQPIACPLVTVSELSSYTLKSRSTGTTFLQKTRIAS